MSEDDALAPIIPLFGGASKQRKSVDAGGDAVDVGPRASGDHEIAGLHPSHRASAQSAPRLRALRPHGSPEGESEAAGDGVDPEQVRVGAEEVLVRRLRTRSLSVSEARGVLRAYSHGEQRLDNVQIDEVIEDFCRRSYLDDVTLAGHLVTSGVERKGQGRIALARDLAQRGIPRDVIDSALSELPDDDFERALDFARTKMRSLARLDQETAKRRLSGQLARRGYSGGVVSNVIRTVMGEQFATRRPSGVRFE